MLEATRMTFFPVERDGSKAEPILRPGVEEVSDFLVAHVESLREQARRGRAANG